MGAMLSAKSLVLRDVEALILGPRPVIGEAQRLLGEGVDVGALPVGAAAAPECSSMLLTMLSAPAAVLGDLFRGCRSASPWVSSTSARSVIAERRDPAGGRRGLDLVQQLHRKIGKNCLTKFKRVLDLVRDPPPGKAGRARAIFFGVHQVRLGCAEASEGVAAIR